MLCMLSAEGTILAELKTIRCVLLVLHGVVVALLAIGAGEHDLNALIRSHACVLLSSGLSPSGGREACPPLPGSGCYSMILMTTPEPTVRPPSRIAKRRPSSHAMGVIRVISMSMLSPGMTISTPSGSLMLPVTSVVRK